MGLLRPNQVVLRCTIGNRKIECPGYTIEEACWKLLSKEQLDERTVVVPWCWDPLYGERASFHMRINAVEFYAKNYEKQHPLILQEYPQNGHRGNDNAARVPIGCTKEEWPDRFQ